MNILLTGSEGQLGRELLPVLAGLGAVTRVDREAPADDAQVLRHDLGDLDRLEALLDALRPDVIVNAAAYTTVDRAEAEAESAFRINEDLPDCLAHWSARHDRLLVHYSTDYVFSGDADSPYGETDPTGPLSVYGESKLDGERAIAASGCRHAVLRTSWLYSRFGGNFVLTMLRLARERSTLSIVSDQVGCPTWARNLARATAVAIARLTVADSGSRRHGTWHYCDSGAVSWYDFARMIFDMALELGLLETAPQTRAVSSADYPQAAVRPPYSVLDTSAIGRDLGVEPAPVQASLRMCLEELKEHESN